MQVNIKAGTRRTKSGGLSNVVAHTQNRVDAHQLALDLGNQRAHATEPGYRQPALMPELAALAGTPAEGARVETVGEARARGGAAGKPAPASGSITPGPSGDQLPLFGAHPQIAAAAPRSTPGGQVSMFDQPAPSVSPPSHVAPVSQTETAIAATRARIDANNRTMGQGQDMSAHFPLGQTGSGAAGQAHSRGAAARGHSRERGIDAAVENVALHQRLAVLEGVARDESPAGKARAASIARARAEIEAVVRALPVGARVLTPHYGMATIVRHNANTASIQTGSGLREAIRYKDLTPSKEQLAAHTSLRKGDLMKGTVRAHERHTEHGLVHVSEHHRVDQHALAETIAAVRAARAARRRTTPSAPGQLMIPGLFPAAEPPAAVTPEPARPAPEPTAAEAEDTMMDIMLDENQPSAPKESPTAAQELAVIVAKAVDALIALVMSNLHADGDEPRIGPLVRTLATLGDRQALNPVSAEDRLAVAAERYRVMARGGDAALLEMISTLSVPFQLDLIAYGASRIGTDGTGTDLEPMYRTMLEAQFRQVQEHEAAAAHAEAMERDRQRLITESANYTGTPLAVLGELSADLTRAGHPNMANVVDHLIHLRNNNLPPELAREFDLLTPEDIRDLLAPVSPTATFTQLYRALQANLEGHIATREALMEQWRAQRQAADEAEAREAAERQAEEEEAERHRAANELAEAKRLANNPDRQAEEALRHERFEWAQIATGLYMHGLTPLSMLNNLSARLASLSQHPHLGTIQTGAQLITANMARASEDELTGMLGELGLLSPKIAAYAVAEAIAEFKTSLPALREVLQRYEDAPGNEADRRDWNNIRALVTSPATGGPDPMDPIGVARSIAATYRHLAGDQGGAGKRVYEAAQNLGHRMIGDAVPWRAKETFKYMTPTEVRITIAELAHANQSDYADVEAAVLRCGPQKLPYEQSLPDFLGSRNLGPSDLSAYNAGTATPMVASLIELHRDAVLQAITDNRTVAVEARNFWMARQAAVYSPLEIKSFLTAVHGARGIAATDTTLGIDYLRALQSSVAAVATSATTPAMRRQAERMNVVLTRMVTKYNSLTGVSRDKLNRLNVMGIQELAARYALAATDPVDGITDTLVNRLDEFALSRETRVVEQDAAMARPGVPWSYDERFDDRSLRPAAPPPPPRAPARRSFTWSGTRASAPPPPYVYVPPRANTPRLPPTPEQAPWRQPFADNAARVAFAGEQIRRPGAMPAQCQRDPATKAIWERTFGVGASQAAVLDLFAPTAGEIELRNTSISISSSQIRITADHYDIGDPGRRVAPIIREIAVGRTNATTRVYNAYFFIDESYQARGYAEQVYSKQFATWKALGVGRGGISANGTIGMYAWALQGMDFRDSYDLRNRRDALKDLLANHDPALRDRYAPMIDAMEHSWDLATFKAHDDAGEEILFMPSATFIDDKHIPPELLPLSAGKYMMLMAGSWGGEIVFDDNHPSYQQHVRYIDRQAGARPASTASAAGVSVRVAPTGAAAAPRPTRTRRPQAPNVLPPLHLPDSLATYSDRNHAYRARSAVAAALAGPASWSALRQLATAVNDNVPGVRIQVLEHRRAVLVSGASGPDDPHYLEFRGNVGALRRHLADVFEMHGRNGQIRHNQAARQRDIDARNQ